MEDQIENIFEKDTNLSSFLENIGNLFQSYTKRLDSMTSELIDEDILQEIKNIIANDGITRVFFGKSLRHIKIAIEDDELRKHEIYVQYKSRRKLAVISVKLPHSSMLNREYPCLQDVIDSFKQTIVDMAKYFHELENIDYSCTIMEPINATFKDDYRRIFLDERTWLHVEVTMEGLATNIHLVGQSEHWHNKLQSGLLKWDHDKNITDNIMTIFELKEFPQPASKVCKIQEVDSSHSVAINEVICGICLCTDLPDVFGMPLPLCQNNSCGVYYHRNCLYQWLVACAGSRVPVFGVATGSCPTCLQPISCSNRDS